MKIIIIITSISMKIIIIIMKIIIIITTIIMKIKIIIIIKIIITISLKCTSMFVPFNCDIFSNLMIDDIGVIHTILIFNLK